ncbi:hypothetical protein Tco_1501801 [Tanacetum coccineum]
MDDWLVARGTGLLRAMAVVQTKVSPDGTGRGSDVAIVARRRKGRATASVKGAGGWVLTSSYFSFVKTEVMIMIVLTKSELSKGQGEGVESSSSHSRLVLGGAEFGTNYVDEEYRTKVSYKNKGQNRRVVNIEGVSKRAIIASYLRQRQLPSLIPSIRKRGAYRCESWAKLKAKAICKRKREEETRDNRGGGEGDTAMEVETLYTIVASNGYRTVRLTDEECSYSGLRIEFSYKCQHNTQKKNVENQVVQRCSSESEWANWCTGKLREWKSLYSQHGSEGTTATKYQDAPRRRDACISHSDTVVDSSKRKEAGIQLHSKREQAIEQRVLRTDETHAPNQLELISTDRSQAG